MPVELAKCATPASALAWARYSACFARASASVGATITLMPMNSFTDCGARPAANAAARTLSTWARVAALLLPLMNTHSACSPAKRRPRAEEPAWNSTGVRCGDGSQRW
ncbi:hypothetical protein D3C84_1023550 [compost metagenome]